MSHPLVRLELMKRSLRCFVCGWFGLIPVLGLPLSICAVVLFARVRAEGVSTPADRYLNWGLALGLLGLAGFLVLGLGLSLLAIRAFVQG